ncbi:MAG: TrmH family RNA methyltransferase [Verrucomicrobia bacterium]|nr:TrmH family RNA methyltransferase [Verrucomicrobiota bacterium]
MDFTKPKFLSLPLPLRHKKAAEFLKALFYGESKKTSPYRNLELWLELPLVDLQNHEEVSSRFYLHATSAGLPLQEHSLLHIRQKDQVSDIPFLDIHIFLYSLRSAFNVGSILRTIEAFRLGTLYCSFNTPGPDHPKVQKTSMGTHLHVPYHIDKDLSTLPRPWIALETASPSTPLNSFLFPKTFTLILGNEEFGIPKHILEQCDHIVEIPLVGGKNSLNVASAFAIVAHHIRSNN